MTDYVAVISLTDSVNEWLTVDEKYCPGCSIDVDFKIRLHWSRFYLTSAIVNLLSLSWHKVLKGFANRLGNVHGEGLEYVGVGNVVGRRLLMQIDVRVA